MVNVETKILMLIISICKYNDDRMLSYIRDNVKQKNFIILAGYISYAQIMWTSCY
jgi:hypothetical protein